MVACMLIYSHVTNRRRRIGRKTFSTYSCYAEFRKSTPYSRQKTRRRVDIEQPLGLDNIKIIVDNALEWRIFHDPRRNDRSFSPPPRQRGRRAIKPSFAASHISQGRRFGAGRSPQTAWRLLEIEDARLLAMDEACDEFVQIAAPAHEATIAQARF